MSKQKIIISIPIVLVIISVIFVLFLKSDESKFEISGIVERKEVDVSSKIPGRIEEIYFKEGDIVKKGDVIARIKSDEIEAKVEQARGAFEAAKSKYLMAVNGLRPEEKEAAKKMYLQAKHQFELAEKTWNRIKKLYQDSVVSTQEKDQVEFQYKAAMEQMDAAKAKYDLAMNGARKEEIAAAYGLMHQAENVLTEVLSYKRELSIVAPIDGELSKRIVDAGEMVASGYPVFTISDLSDTWVTIQVRETQLNHFKKGTVVEGVIPALNNTKEKFTVTYLSPMGEFSNWRPTNQKGDFDIKTFEVRLRCNRDIKDLRPGMTVNFSIK